MNPVAAVETFDKARELAKAAMNRAQAHAEAVQKDAASTWTFIADGWARVADLYRERTP